MAKTKKSIDLGLATSLEIHLSVAHAPLPLPLGESRPPIANFLTGYLCTSRKNISPNVCSGLYSKDGCTLINILLSRNPAQWVRE